MIVSTSDSGDPARINLRISSTASFEKKPDSHCGRSARDSSCKGDSIACSMSFLSGGTPREEYATPGDGSSLSRIDLATASTAAPVYAESVRDPIAYRLTSDSNWAWANLTCDCIMAPNEPAWLISATLSQCCGKGLPHKQLLPLELAEI